MKIAIESTGTMESVNGVPARVWKGTTEGGVEVMLWIPIIRVARDADGSQLERELMEIQVDHQLVSFDMRMVLE